MLRAGRFIACSVAFAIASFAARPVGAVLPYVGVSSGGLEAAPGVPRIRTNVRAGYGSVPPARRAAWVQFVADAGGTWDALWDLDTDVPLRIYGSGLRAPGAVQSAAVAEATARLLLERHLALLAPVAAASDFVLVADVLERGL